MKRKKIGQHLATLAAAAALFLGASGAALAQYNLPPPQSPIAQQIYDLHTLIMWIIVVVFVVVFGAMTYAIVMHRKSIGHAAVPFHENTTVEILWTVVPFVILLGMAFPATQTVLAMRDTSNPDLTIKATGYQWKWGYDYLTGEGQGIAFYSTLATPIEQIEGKAPKGEHYLLEVDNNLVVPVGKKIRIITTANDVIHAFWVPALGIKQDSIPGFVRDTWFKADREGVYRGQCAELCGKNHGFMPIVVEVLSLEKYSAWVADQQKKMAALADDPNKVWTPDELKARGDKVFAQNCVACHQATGLGVPGAFPALVGAPSVLGTKDEQIQILLKGVVKNGKPTAMASFKQLSDAELAAVMTYTRFAWSNAGKGKDPVVLPADVKVARK